MPFKSEAQRRWMYANKPEMAKEWEKETPKGSKLPKRVAPKSVPKGMGRAQLKKMKGVLLDKHRAKIGKVTGHVEMRAKTRSNITNDEINKLRKYILTARLRKGETYHYTWPGRGHAIIGDIGKKKPKHVVKTIYKPSDSPPGRILMVKSL